MDYQDVRSPERSPERGDHGSTTPAPVPDFSLRDPIDSFIETCRRLVTGPVPFFAGLPTNGGYRNPLAFGTICVLIATIVGTVLGFGLQALFLLPLLGQGSGGDFPFAAATTAIVLLGIFVAVVVLTPLFAAIGLFLGAGIYHLFVMLLVRPNMGYEATFRATAYSSIAQFASAIPFVGIFGAFLYLFLVGVGIREMHHTTTGRAAAVVLLPILLILLLMCALVLMFFVVVFANA